MSTHTCPWKSCARNVSAGMLACRPHWYALPEELRVEIWKAWRAVPHDARRHRRAVSAAMAWYREHSS